MISDRIHLKEGGFIFTYQKIRGIRAWLLEQVTVVQECVCAGWKCLPDAKEEAERKFIWE